MKTKIIVPYGEKTEEVTVEKRNLAGILNPKMVRAGNTQQIILDALNNPLNSESFEEFLNSSDKVLCVVNDGTRPTPTYEVIKVVYDKLTNKEFEFIISTGTHREPTDAEYRFIFGDFYSEFKNRIYVHKAQQEDDMVYLGKTSFGTEVSVNRIGIEAENILIISSVEPHYFAGYTGGRKSIVPGIAAYKTVEHNHRLALDRRALPCALKGNPLHEDLVEAVNLYIKDRNIFSIMLVLDKEHRVYAATAGNIEDSFYSAVQKADEVFCVETEEKADVVVAVTIPPMDIDLYQSHKSLEHAKLALKDDGILILVSKCRDGIGNRAFYDLLSSSGSPDEVIEKIKEGYKLGYHKAAKIADMLSHMQIWTVVGLEDKVVKDIFLKPFHSVQEAVDEALGVKGEKAKILFLMDANVVVPKVTSSNY